MIVKSATEPGDPNTPNEDWVHASEDLLIVVDGATARTETGCIHGVAWYAEHLGLALVTSLKGTALPMRDGLATAISHVASLHPECDLDHPGTPSAALGVVRLTEDSVETMVLADVAIVLQGPDGDDIRVILDDRVSSSAKAKRAAATALPVDHPDREAALRQMKLAQQQEKNRPGGFFVAASRPEAAQAADVGSYPVASIAAIAVLSDGVFRAVNEFCAMSWPELMSGLSSVPAKMAIGNIRVIEQSDPSAIRWPRTKVSDDATVANLSS